MGRESRRGLELAFGGGGFAAGPGADLVLGGIDFLGGLIAEDDAEELGELVAADDELLLGAVAFDLEAGGGFVEVADEVEVEIEELGGVVGEPFPLDALLAGHVGAGDAALLEGALPVVDAALAAEHFVRVGGDVADGEDAFFVGLEVLVDRGAVGVGEGGILDEAEIRLGAHGDDGEAGGETLAAFGLDVFEDGAAFEAVELFAHEHLDAVLGVVLGEPGAGLLIEEAAKEAKAAVDDGDLGLRVLGEDGGGFGGDVATADDDDLVLEIDGLAQGLEIAQGAEVEDVADIVAGDLGTAGAAAGGHAGFAELDGLAIGEDGDVALEVDLRDEGIEPEVDVVLVEPIVILHEELVERRGVFAELRLEEQGTLVGEELLGAGHHHCTLLIVLADARANTRASDAGTDDEVIATYHFAGRINRSVSRTARKICGSLSIRQKAASALISLGIRRRMISLTIDQLTKRFGDATALHAISLRIEPGEIFFLLGPSGCGKTTLLRSIAGFYIPEGGRILFGDDDVTRVPPHQRNTGMMFQSYALWPHMTVAQNVAFGLEERRVARPEIDQRVTQALESVKMGPYAARKINQLSGGQQQRVALARALVIRPRCLLLDEPLSNLDTKLRIEMRTEIRRVCKEFGLTAIYVTHDQKEALSIADRMAIMEGGHIRQAGRPAEVYRAPHSKFVADFMGETNFIEGVIAEVRPGRVIVSTALCQLEGIVGGDAWVPKPGDKATLSIRPESWKLGVEKGAVNVVSGHIRDRVYLGEMAQYQFATSGGNLLKMYELNPRFVELSPERELYAAADPEDVVALPG